MATTETENGAGTQYVPFTPFQEGYAFEAEPSTLNLSEQFEATRIDTPFVSEYEGVEPQTPESAEARDLLFELYDEQFDEALAEIADQAWDAVRQRAEPFGETGASAAATAEEFLQEWSQPVRQAAETMLENIAQGVSEHGVASMSESEVDQFFEQFEPRGTGLEPHFENFLGGLWDKAKKLAKKGLAVAKKGLTLIPGLRALISKLKGLVRPLLDRVLRMAIDKLPPTLRPLARQLAQRVLGTKVGEVEGEEFEQTPAAPDVAAFQRQFDFDAAALMFAADETDQEVVLNEAVYGAERQQGDTVAQLQDARSRFVGELEAGVEPERAMEQFIPAVMAMLPIARTAISLIGRERIVDMLAKLLAGFVKRYVPAEAATQLSTAIVDAGMRMLSLETPVENEANEPRIAWETIAQTVEDTVRRVGELDETVFEDSALLEAEVTDAFHEAAAENFPPQLIASELHEAPLSATWVLMPTGRRRKYYKKYTQIFDVEITAQMAASVATFGGTKLDVFLKDRLGVIPPVRARVHLYQAISGTTLPRIARLERNVQGLGTGAHGAMQLHPLTVQAAGTLLQHPRLGRNVSGEFLSSRRAVAAGERFYHLEIAGARPVIVSTTPGATQVVRRTSRVNVTLDFPRDEFRVFVYLSESEAQEIAAKIRTHDLTSVLVLAKRVYEPGVSVALGGDIRRHVKILTEAPPQEQLFGGQLKQLAPRIRERLTKKIAHWVGRAIAEYMKASAGEFVAASEDPADGVTLVVQIVNPPGGPLVRKLLRGEGGGPTMLGDLESLFKGQPRLSVKTIAGLRVD
jgi:hypothetical protein